ncbi:HAD family hydrolase [Candidatus Woesearchaeota archaeon]|nr:HAD family hydrolase [Candidatus Woesearchaeota archaeon]
MKIKAIIFDVDNTLINTGNISAKAYISTAKELGLKQVSINKIKCLFGIPSHVIIKKFWPETGVKNFQEIKHKKILSKKVKQIPGAKNIIRQLYGKYKLGLLSSKTRVLMYPHLKQIGLSTNYFKFIYSADDVKFHKPNPKVFSKALNKLKLKRNEILYVGDSIYDFIATKKAKLNFTAVLTGHYRKKDFQRLGLKKENILNSINDLPRWLNKNG